MKRSLLSHALVCLSAVALTASAVSFAQQTTRPSPTMVALSARVATLERSQATASTVVHNLCHAIRNGTLPQPGQPPFADRAVSVWAESLANACNWY